MTVAYVILLGAGLAILVTAILAAGGRLPRNYVAGIRTPSLLRSEPAWRAGHAAAAPWLVGAGAVVTIGAVALIAVRPDELAGAACLLALTGIMGVLVGVAMRVAGRAAREVG